MKSFLATLDAFTRDARVRAVTYVLLFCFVGLTIFAAVRVGNISRDVDVSEGANRILAGDLAKWERIANDRMDLEIEAKRERDRFELWWRKSQCVVYQLSHSPEHAQAYASIEDWDRRPDWWQPLESIRSHGKATGAEIEGLAGRLQDDVDAGRVALEPGRPAPVRWSSEISDPFDRAGDWYDWTRGQTIIPEIETAVQQWLGEAGESRFNERIENVSTGATYHVTASKGDFGAWVSIQFLPNTHRQ